MHVLKLCQGHKNVVKLIEIISDDVSITHAALLCLLLVIPLHTCTCLVALLSCNGTLSWRRATTAYTQKEVIYGT